jgi:hypothetical protein
MSTTPAWTVETLKAHYDQRLLDAEKAVNAALASAQSAVSAALAAAEKAVEKAETNAEKWRQNANEWRGSMLDREEKFAPKDQMETELKSIRREIEELRKEVQGLRESRASEGGADIRGKAVVDTGRANAMLVIAVIGSIVSIGVAVIIVSRFFTGR